MAIPLQLGFADYEQTYAKKKTRRQIFLSELAGALAAFATGLERLPNRPAVTLLAVSEFGRRLRENGSGGTTTEALRWPLSLWSSCRSA